MSSILAGFFIGLAATVNLCVGGGVIGALLFSFGLLTILVFKFELFTGQAGKLATGDITPGKLAQVWLGNLIGTFGSAMFVWIPFKAQVIEGATSIISQRIDATPFNVFMLAIPCGILMYVAVFAYNNGKSAIFTMLPVMVFILSGFCHCVADMAYMWFANPEEVDFFTAFGNVIGATLGNIIGCNLIPMCAQENLE